MARSQRHPVSRDLPVIFEVSTPTEIDDDTGDEQSYTFTLDGVGFDEESGSIMHTPPGLQSFGHALNANNEAHRKHETELHRETCRQLGIPFDEGNVSPGRDSSLSGSSPSENGSTPGRKENWPWPEAGKGNKEDDMFDVSLESNGLAKVEGKNSSNDLKATSKPKLPTINLAKVSGVSSLYTSSMKNMATSFADRSRNTYMTSKRKRITNGVNDSSKRSNINIREFYSDWNRDTNPVAKFTVGATMIFMMVCIVAVVAVIGRSDNSSRPSLEESGPTVTVGNPLLFVQTPSADSTFGNTTSVESTIESTIVSDAVSATTHAPTITPTRSPFNVDISLSGSSSSSGSKPMENCVNKAGQFKTHRGKHRECHWLTIHNTGMLYSERQDDNCGVDGKDPSELGLNCRYTCRAYNGCMDGEGGKEEKIAMVQAVPEKVATSTPTEAPTLKPTQNKSGGGIQAESVELPKFIDSNGRERPCTWLNIRNMGQRKIRRETNCINASVQLMCPRSCAEFTAVSTSTNISNTVLKDKQKKNVPPLQRIHAPVPQDLCFDGDGYYLNELDHPYKCEWLVDKNDPLDDSRKIKNCGITNGYPNPTDLGIMCKATCGNCD